MKSLFDYINPDKPMLDADEAHYYDDMAEKMHDRSVYDIIKRGAKDMHPTLVTALLESLDSHDFDLIDQCIDWFAVKLLRGKMLYGRKKRAKPKNTTHRLNYPIEEVLADYVNRRTGKVVEAKRQFKKRFDGLDHDMQEKVMMALMDYGGQVERNFIYDKLYGEEFWTDDYIPLIQEWHTMYPCDWKLAKVIVKYCPRDYILEHLDELKDRCNYATLCLRTGIAPDPDKLPCWTYLYVLKTIGRQLRLSEGEEVLLKWVRQYLYEKALDKPVCSIYDIPYVRRMMAYLGEMGMIEDLMAIDELNNKMRSVHRTKWGSAVIKVIEDKFNFPPYIYKNVE